MKKQPISRISAIGPTNDELDDNTCIKKIFALREGGGGGLIKVKKNISQEFCGPLSLLKGDYCIIIITMRVIQRLLTINVGPLSTTLAQH